MPKLPGPPLTRAFLLEAERAAEQLLANCTAETVTLPDSTSDALRCELAGLSAAVQVKLPEPVPPASLSVIQEAAVVTFQAQVAAAPVSTEIVYVAASAGIAVPPLAGS
jgi:hypothetical protein